MSNNPSFPSKPSSWLRKKERLELLMRESRSSRMSTQGAISLALSNTACMAYSSPAQDLNDLTYRGEYPRASQSFMIAFMLMVFPFPARASQRIVRHDPVKTYQEGHT